MDREELRTVLKLLVHASDCQSGQQCQGSNCRLLKGLFRHGNLCKVRANGGCPHCIKMWLILRHHAEACKEAECTVPRCKDLKKHLGF